MFGLSVFPHLAIRLMFLAVSFRKTLFVLIYTNIFQMFSRYGGKCSKTWIRITMSWKLVPQKGKTILGIKKKTCLVSGRLRKSWRLNVYFDAKKKFKTYEHRWGRCNCQMRFYGVTGSTMTSWHTTLIIWSTRSSTTS